MVHVAVLVHLQGRQGLGKMLHTQLECNIAGESMPSLSAAPQANCQPAGVCGSPQAASASRNAHRPLERRRSKLSHRSTGKPCRAMLSSPCWASSG